MAKIDPEPDRIKKLSCIKLSGFDLSGWLEKIKQPIRALQTSMHKFTWEIYLIRLGPGFEAFYGLTLAGVN